MGKSSVTKQEDILDLCGKWKDYHNNIGGTNGFELINRFVT